ncbi:MAG: RluA family pseudouridine synthase [Myxococcales bacterium]|nr:RluA family pseudouridine synthase [Myxococcales bacterium]
MRPASSPSICHEFEIPAASTGQRLDQFLSQQDLPFSRSQIARRIDEGEVLVDGRPSKPGHRLRKGQRVVFVPPPPQPSDLAKEAIPLDVLFEDRHLIVLHKPAGMVVHPAPGHSSGTLVNALLHHCGELPFPPRYVDDSEDGDEIPPELEDAQASPSAAAARTAAPTQLSIGGKQRPGIVHRLDQGTSGVLVVAKDEPTLIGLQAQFQAHSIRRRYLAIVEGTPSAAGSFSTRYGRHPTDRKRFTGRSGAKHAVTHFRVLEPLPEGPAALVEVSLETGRTHQIRVHFSEAGLPLLGDPLYGSHRPNRGTLLRSLGQALARQALHAAVLGFQHPITQTWLEYSTPAPADFQEALSRLRGPMLSLAPQAPSGGSA